MNAQDRDRREALDHGHHSPFEPVAGCSRCQAPSAASGCYKCGQPVREFGAFVSPAVVDFLAGKCFPQVARWWTKCKDCGYVEVQS